MGDCPDELHCSVQHEHVYYNDDADMECISDMWENWLQITSELPTLNNVVFDETSACTSPLTGIFSSQTSESSLTNSNKSRPGAMDTSFTQPSPLSSDATSHVTNEHSFYEDNHVNEHLDTTMDILTIANPPTLEMNLAAKVSPLLNLEGSAGHPRLYLKARASPHKMKTPGRNHRNNGARKNEETKTFLVESSSVAMDDGYMWRKYGQKNIKDRIHPRAYFKCAQPNCPVKKQTETSSGTQGFLLITYFGKHDH